MSALGHYQPLSIQLDEWLLTARSDPSWPLNCRLTSSLTEHRFDDGEDDDGEKHAKQAAILLLVVRPTVFSFLFFFHWFLLMSGEWRFRQSQAERLLSPIEVIRLASNQRY